MLDDAEQSSGPTEDDALGGDLDLEPQDAEQVTGGAASMCPACSHTHHQGDVKCNPGCTTHGATTRSGGFY